MNERIKQLTEQCYEHDQSWTGVGQRIFNKEKFAELIVQEYSYDVMNLHGASPERVAMAAKHWGVEL